MGWKGRKGGKVKAVRDEKDFFPETVSPMDRSLRFSLPGLVRMHLWCLVPPEATFTRRYIHAAARMECLSIR